MVNLWAEMREKKFENWLLRTYMHVHIRYTNAHFLDAFFALNFWWGIKKEQSSRSQKVSAMMSIAFFFQA
jgi:hypothetical protein